MGGTTFAISKGDQPAVHCPRMAPDTYVRMRETFTAKLVKQFAHVMTPVEAPEKVDHGDVDFIVSDPLDSDGSVTPSTDKESLNTANTLHDIDFRGYERSIGQLLNAERSQCAPPILSFAIPHCSSTRLDSNGTLEENEKGCAATTTRAHVQVDIKICTSQTQLRWMYFKNSYGDLTSILGAGLHPLSMTLTTTGLVVRIPSIKSADLTSPVASTKSVKTACELVVSEDPTVVMCFLGLDAKAWSNGFKTEEEAFHWLSSSPLLDRTTFLRLPGQSSKVQDENIKPADGAKQRASYRRKFSRDIFRRFVEDWLPAHPDVFASVRESFRNEESAVEQAINFFGKQSEYQERLETFKRDQTEARFWYRVQDLVPEDKSKANKTLRGLRRWVKFKDGMPVILGTPVLNDEQHPYWTVTSTLNQEELLHWIEDHGEHCMRLERERVKVEAELRKTARELLATSTPPQST